MGNKIGSEGCLRLLQPALTLAVTILKRVVTEGSPATESHRLGLIAMELEPVWRLEPACAGSSSGDGQPHGDLATAIVIPM